MQRALRVARALMTSLAFTLLFAPQAARSAVFVSDMAVVKVGTYYTLHYLLNESATSGRLSIATSSAPSTPVETAILTAAQLTKGPHEVRLYPLGYPPGTYIFAVQVTAAQHNGYELITPVTSIAERATVAYGLRVNRSPGTLGYGHIYFADFQDTANSRHPLHEFAADGTYAQDIWPEYASQYSTVGAAVGPDGSLYISDQDTNSIRHYTASGSPVTPTWTLHKVYTGPVMDPARTPPTGSLATRSLQVFGSGASAAVYLTDYTVYPNQVETAVLDDTSSSAGLVFACTSITGRLDQLLVAPDRKSIYIASGTVPGFGRHLNRWLFGLNPTTNRSEWSLDPGFAENESGLATLLGNARGLAFSNSGDLMWVTQNGGPNCPASQNYIAKVTLTSLAQSISRARDALAFAAGMAKPTLQQIRALDTDANQRITLEDAEAIIRMPSSVGAVIERVPVPAGAPLPVTLDVDVKGNLVVGANSSAAADGTTANVFYILAPPDYGSQDSSVSSPFQVG